MEHTLGLFVFVIGGLAALGIFSRVMNRLYRWASK